MKNKVIEYFLNDGSFEVGKQLYINYPGASKSLIKQLQFQSDNKNNREILHYELAKLAGVNLNQIGKMKKQVKADQVERTPPTASPSVVSKVTPQVVLETLGSLSYHEKKALIKKLGIETPDNKGETITKALEEHYSVQITAQSKINSDGSTEVEFETKTNKAPEGNE